MLYLIQIEVWQEVIFNECSCLLVLLFHNLLLFAEYLFKGILVSARLSVIVVVVATRHLILIV